MALSLPHTIVPGTPQNSTDARENDVANADAIDNYLGRWRLLTQAFGSTQGMTSGVVVPFMVGVNWTSEGISNDPAHLVIITAADLAVPDYTTEMRIVASAAVGVTDPNSTLLVGLYPFTTSGASVMNYAPGTVLNALSQASLTLDTNGVVSDRGQHFDVPANGVYILGAVCSPTFALNNELTVTAQLQYRNV